MSVSTARAFWCRAYLENENDLTIDDIIKVFKQYQTRYALIVHDEDVYDGTDGTHSTGELKPIHCHFIVIFNNPKPTSTIIHLFNDKAHVEQAEDVGYCYQYLTHETATCKSNGDHVYSAANIITNARKYFVHKAHNDCDKHPNDFQTMFVDYSLCCRGLLSKSEFLIRYGRDGCMMLHKLHDMYLWYYQYDFTAIPDYPEVSSDESN